MKQVQFRLRTSEKVENWLELASQIRKWDSTPLIRINGKQKNSEGFYSAVRCNVDACDLIDVVTELLVYVEKKPTNSFDVIVKDIASTNVSQVSGKEDSIG